MKSARRRAREFALQGIYQWLLTGEDSGAIEAHLRDNTFFAQADQPYFKILFHGTFEQQPVLVEEITRQLDRPINELSPVEHGILLMGAFELKTQLDIPYRVVINEAVEVAKTFGGTDGFRYVNGILDKLAPIYRSHEVNNRK